MITHIHQEKNFFMLQSPLINDLNMFDTLSFSQKMQKAGMTEILANEMAFTLRDMNVGHFNKLLTREEFQKFEKEVRIEMENLVTKTEFQNFENEMRKEIEYIHDDIQEIRVEFKNEIEKMVTKTEFNTKIKNLELNITIKMGVIMAAGISILTMIIKM